jgi:hypothetical protein
MHWNELNRAGAAGRATPYMVVTPAGKQNDRSDARIERSGARRV